MNNHELMIQLIRQFSGQARVLTIPRIYVDLTGSIEAGLFLSQCIYWSDRTSRTDGYFYKSYADWMQETGMSRRQLDNARKLCAGWVTTQTLKANGAPTLHYRVELEQLATDIAAHVQRANGFDQNVQIHLPETYKSLTESTTEITTDNLTTLNSEPAYKRLGFLDAPGAEDVYRRVTGFMSVPSLGREDTLRMIIDIHQVKQAATVEYLQPFYKAWIARRTRDNRPYPAGGNGWLDWAATGVIPEQASQAQPARARPASTKPKTKTEEALDELAELKRQAQEESNG